METQLMSFSGHSSRERARVLCDSLPLSHGVNFTSRTPTPELSHLVRDCCIASAFLLLDRTKTESFPNSCLHMSHAAEGADGWKP